MNLQHLQYFKVAAELQHITKASNALHIAQPALSKIIKMMEEELQVLLFDRIGKNIYLNKNGKILLSYVNRMDEEIKQMQEELNENRKKENQSITILLKATPMLIVRLVQMFRMEYPDISVRLLTYNYHVNETYLKYDFQLESSMKEKSHENTIILLKENIVLAVPKDHSWAGKEVDLAEAVHENFIGFPSFYLQEKETRQLCKTAGFTPTVVLESSDYFTIQGMIAAKVGIAIIPELSLRFQKNPNIAYARIKSPKCHNTISLSWESNDALSDAGIKFKKYVEASLASNEILV